MEVSVEIIMSLIIHGGNARSAAMMAIKSAKQGKFDEADNYIEQAKVSLNQAHHSQTELLTLEAGGEKMEISLLMIHAQDHLMNAITVKDMAIEFVDLYKEKGE
ncbi:PTS lactose/cellobiose transporter subunit IIA [Streptococcus suis]|nr:PTS lactose/cellobiose transporter subunit IIA [Streptococcus suis]